MKTYMILLEFILQLEKNLSASNLAKERSQRHLTKDVEVDQPTDSFQSFQMTEAAAILLLPDKDSK